MIHQLSPSIQVIALTGFQEQDLIEKALQASAILLSALHVLNLRLRVVAVGGRPEARKAALTLVPMTFSKADPPGRLPAVLRILVARECPGTPFTHSMDRADTYPLV